LCCVPFRLQDSTEQVNCVLVKVAVCQTDEVKFTAHVYFGIFVEMFINLDTKQRCMDSVSHQPLSPRYPMKRWRRYTRTNMDETPKRNISAACGNRTRISGQQARRVVSVQAELLCSVWTDRKQN
jgi:hypothetical protein